MSFGLSTNRSCLPLSGDPELENMMLTPELWRQGEHYIAHAILEILLFITGVLLNTYLLAVIFLKHLYSQPTYLLLLNLAIADMLMCTLVFPFHIAIGFSGQYSFGNSDYIRCAICEYAGIFLMLTILSPFNLAMLSMDWKEASVVDQARTRKELLLKEALHIGLSSEEQRFNRDVGLELQGCWVSTLKALGK